MTEGSITLSHAELDRVSVIRSIISRRLTPAQAAPRLQLSVRQVQRLTRAYHTCSAAGRASTHRGRGPGNALSDVLRPQALASIRAHYIDFGPTLPTSSSPNGMLAIARWRPSTNRLTSRAVRWPFIALSTVSCGSIIQIRKANQPHLPAPSRPWTLSLFTPTPRRQKGV